MNTYAPTTKEEAAKKTLIPIRDYLGVFREGNRLGRELPCRLKREKPTIMDLRKSHDPYFYISTIKRIASA